MTRDPLATGGTRRHVLPSSSIGIHQLDWDRLLPNSDHRWTMGLRRGDFAEFFASREVNGRLLAERADWLTSDPEKYLALTPQADSALSETLELAKTQGLAIDPTLTAAEQLLELGMAWEPDFVWMHPLQPAAHWLTGGVVCFPSSWSLQDKLGNPMTFIHQPVPELNASLGRQIEAFLSALIPGESWTRENLGFSRDGERNHHPSRHHRPLDSTVTIREVWLRIEHQLLLKLPQCGSILFGIRVEVLPFTELIDEPLICERLIRALSTMSAEIAAYKGLGHARSRLIDLLKQSL